MDILLTHAYFLAEDAHERRIMKPYAPLGILYLASHLKARGFATGVYDATFGSLAEFGALVARERPAVVGIGVNLMTRRNALAMAREARAAGARVVLGGPEPINYAEEYLARGVDVVVAGEGELTLAELVPHLAAHGPAGMAHIAGIAFREDGAVVRTAARPAIADLDAQPFPDRGAIDLERYLATWRAHHGEASVSLITARGCPYTCTWCSHSVYGYSHRRRSPANVADELERIVADYRPDAVWYADDVFTINPKWLDAYARELAGRRLAVPFETITREDRLDDAVIRTLAAMGCRRLWVGAESGSQPILDAMKRKTDAARVRKVVRDLRAAGIATGMFVMLGYEGEEEGDLADTVAMLVDADPDTFLTTVSYPIKGTPYWEQVRDRLVAPAAWEESSDRDLVVAGRRSRRYYASATRWLVNEVALARARRSGAPWRRRLRAFLNARLGRLGMALRRGERERASGAAAGAAPGPA